MATKLWKHQQAALDFIGNKPGALLAMGMGTGKSCVAIHALDSRAADTALILCPKSVAAVWPDQFAQHSSRPWRVVTLAKGTDAQRVKDLKQAMLVPRRPVAVVANYDILPSKRGLGLELLKIKWDGLVLDECHKLKSAAGKQSRAAARIKAPFRLGLTGTPMPHSPLDIYAQFRAIDKRIYGTSHSIFKRTYAVMGGFQGHKVTGYQNLDELHRLMYMATYRCKTEDVLDLPPTMDVTRTFDLGRETRKAYDAMKLMFIAEWEAGIVTADNALVKLLRLAQMTSGFATADDGTHLHIGNEKREALGEVLDALMGEREPIVVFARFRHDLAVIREEAAARGWKDGEKSGSVDDMERWRVGDVNCLATQLQAGGVGIDLTRARYCIYYGHDFNMGNYDQSRARVHRPGQTRPVTYVHLVAERSIDVDILKALEERSDMVESVMSGLWRA